MQQRLFMELIIIRDELWKQLKRQFLHLKTNHINYQ